MFIRIKPFILKFAKRPEISQNLEEQKIKRDWQDIVGSVNKSARGKSEALYINERGELVARAADHLWLQELSFYKEEIKRAVLKSSSAKVRSVRFVI